MERVELRRFGDQVHLVIDDRVCAVMRPATISSNFPCPPDSTIPSVEIAGVPSGHTSFVDVPCGERVATQVWRDALIAEMRTIMGPERHFHGGGGYYHGSSQTQRLADALREAANAFGGHFAPFFEILCEWMAARPLGSVTADAEATSSASPTPDLEPPGVR